MSNMTIKVEFMLSTTIKQAIQEAREKAIKWDVAFVEFDFNGTKVAISQQCDINKALKEWDKVKLTYKSLVA